MNKSDKKTHLKHYLHLYLSKPNLKMKNVMKGILYRLDRDKKITINQFNSIISYLEREREFRGNRREIITNFYSKLIVGEEYRSRNIRRLLWQEQQVEHYLVDY